MYITWLINVLQAVVTSVHFHFSAQDGGTKGAEFFRILFAVEEYMIYS